MVFDHSVNKVAVSALTRRGEACDDQEEEAFLENVVQTRQLEGKCGCK